MSVDDVLLEFEMGKEAALEYLEREFVKIQTGRATTSAFEAVQVEIPAWGGSFRLQEVGSLSVTDPLTVCVTLFDGSIEPDVERSLLKANLGVSVNAKDGRIFLSVPVLSAERRQELVREAERLAEECRVSVRNHRRDTRSALSPLTAEVGEDEVRRAEATLEKEVTSTLEEIGARLQAKSAAILDS